MLQPVMIQPVINYDNDNDNDNNSNGNDNSSNNENNDNSNICNITNDDNDNDNSSNINNGSNDDNNGNEITNSRLSRGNYSMSALKRRITNRGPLLGSPKSFLPFRTLISAHVCHRPPKGGSEKGDPNK